MEYASFGSGNKNFIILPGLSIHSVIGLKNAVAAAYRIFAEEYTVYIFDAPQVLPDTTSIRSLADDTAKTMRAIGIEKADILGVSMGGMIAAQLAADYPGLVNKAVLGSTLARPDGYFAGMIEKWIDLAGSRDETALLESFADHVYSENTLREYKESLIFSWRGITDEEYKRFTVLAKAVRAVDVMDDLKRIQCPVLVIGARGDKAVSAGSISRISDVLKCSLYMYGNEYGHAVYDEAPDYKKRCLDFFRGI